MKRGFLLILALVAGLCLVAKPRYSNRQIHFGNIQDVKYVRNYDGDTITVDIPGYPSIIGEDISIRINGIDTPEMRGKCNKEKALAKIVKLRVKSILSAAQSIELRNIQRGKYFRILADVWVDGRSIERILIQENLAVPYHGGTKTFEWCK